MEISLIDEEPHIEIIGNQKALKYRVRYNGKGINNVPVFKNWLDLMKTEHEYEGIVYYCVNCFSFFHFKGIREKNSFTHRGNNCLTSIHFAKFCQYCGELYTYDSICCYKKGLETIKKEYYDIISLDCTDYLFIIPFISLMFYFIRIFIVTFNFRLKKYDINYKYACFDKFIDNKCKFTFFLLFFLCYSLAYLIFFTGIYIWHIFLFIKIRKLKEKDKNEHFVRY